MLLDLDHGNVKIWLWWKTLVPYLVHFIIEIRSNAYGYCFRICHSKIIVHKHQGVSTPMEANHSVYIMRCTLGMIGGLNKKNCRWKQYLCHSYVAQTKLCWQQWLEVRVYGQYTSLLVICQNALDRSLLVMQFSFLLCYLSFQKDTKHPILVKAFIKCLHWYSTSS
jgi:hypothetical protein